MIRMDKLSREKSESRLFEWFPKMYIDILKIGDIESPIFAQKTFGLFFAYSSGEVCS